MRRVKSVLLWGLISAALTGCGKAGESEASGSLSEEDFWRVEDAGEENVRFSTGLEVVYPESWQGNTVLREESGAVAFCEKGNADAGIGGDLFYLCLIERTQGMIVLPDWSKVLGLYEQGGREYVLVQDQPGDRLYSEEEQSLIDAYLALSETMDNVIIKTDNMQGFTECGIEDLSWVQYESEMVYDPPRPDYFVLK